MSRWRCELCGKTLNSKASLDYHLKRHRDPAKHYCPFCQHFISKEKIASHDLVKCAQTAGLEKKYECRACGKRFKGLASLQLHRAIHEEKKFSCQFCERSFTQKGNMRTHIQKKHKQMVLASPDAVFNTNLFSFIQS